SHCCGVGEPASEEVVRAMMLLRANTLAKGYSGVRPVVIETLVRLLNAGIYPVVPVKGSVGASGDLAPLSHLAAVLVGEGEVIAASWDALEHVRDILERELNAATDNPLIFPPESGLSLTDCQNGVVSGGNFHGMPVAMALDQACIAVAAIANIAERRIFHLT